MSDASSPPTAPSGPRLPLFAGGLAALLASACCLGPLILVLLGISGAWIAQLTRLEPYRPYLLGLAVFALALAAWQIWRPRAACQPGQVCALPPVRRAYKRLFWVVAALVLLALVYPVFAPLFY